MKHYTLGFVFDSNMDKVLLIHKNRPEWQKGKMNGPGGKIEEKETPHECVAREIREETGLLIPPEKWTIVGEMENAEWNVKIFAAVHAGDSREARSITDETIEWADVKQLPENVIPNLQWIVPLCREKLLHGEIHFGKIDYV